MLAAPTNCGTFARFEDFFSFVDRALYEDVKQQTSAPSFLQYHHQLTSNIRHASVGFMPLPVSLLVFWEWSGWVDSSLPPEQQRLPLGGASLLYPAYFALL